MYSQTGKVDFIQFQDLSIFRSMVVRPKPSEE